MIVYLEVYKKLNKGLKDGIVERKEGLTQKELLITETERTILTEGRVIKVGKTREEGGRGKLITQEVG